MPARGAPYSADQDADGSENEIHEPREKVGVPLPERERASAAQFPEFALWQAMRVLVARSQFFSCKLLSGGDRVRRWHFDVRHHTSSFLVRLRNRVDRLGKGDADQDIPSLA